MCSFLTGAKEQTQNLAMKLRQKLQQAHNINLLLKSQLKAQREAELGNLINRTNNQPTHKVNLQNAIIF